MAKFSLQHWLKSLNRQLALERLIETIDKAEALLEMSVTHQAFLNQSPATVHNYLCALNTLLIEARRHCNQVLQGK
jgi:hypothetical protein